MDICLIESDEGMREALTSVFEDAHHSVRHHWPPESVLEFLRASATPYVVVMSNQAPDNALISDVLEQVAADHQLATRNRYVVLTTSASGFSPQGQALLAKLKVSVVAKPFNIDALLAAIDG